MINEELTKLPAKVGQWGVAFGSARQALTWGEVVDVSPETKGLTLCEEQGKQTKFWKREFVEVHKGREQAIGRFKELTRPNKFSEGG